MNPQRRLRVLVVDDHDVVHWGLKVLLSQQPWVERYLSAHSAQEGVELARRYEPHVALVDVFLGVDAGTAVCQQIRSVSPCTRVLLFSGSTRISQVAVQAAGGSGFVRKEWEANDIARAVRMVGLGMGMFQPASENQNDGARLSAREQEVLRLLAAGATAREIADKLYLSVHTIKDYTKAIYKKVGARNRADAVLRAERSGLLA